MRCVLEIAYNGGPWAGWQIQPGVPTVQEELNHALQTVLRHTVTSIGAGRTDAGVHAEQLFVQFDTHRDIQQDFLYKLNSILPYTIGVRGLYLPQKENFNARFDATARMYRYTLLRWKDPIRFAHGWHLRREPDWQIMQQAADLMLKYPDFAAFCKAGGDPGATTKCDVREAFFYDDGPHKVFQIRANRFLRGMVRATVGALVKVGNGDLGLDVFEAMLAGVKRTAQFDQAPARGLCLMEVTYPEGMLKKLL